MGASVAGAGAAPTNGKPRGRTCGGGAVMQSSAPKQKLSAAEQEANWEAMIAAERAAQQHGTRQGR